MIHRTLCNLATGAPVATAGFDDASVISKARALELLAVSL